MSSLFMTGILLTLQAIWIGVWLSSLLYLHHYPLEF
ncbi:MPPV-313 ankyrin repeat protein [Magpiepox virus 2]|nr:MPPV-313 ankyrin repeat protein [Magpiepox virus 2]